MTEKAPDGGPKGNRVWADGCYDMVHFGHANQLRQAKQFGKTLVVGVHSDEEIKMHKGPPVFNEEERYRMVAGIKWVDEVVIDAPYVTTVETLEAHKVDFCIHGDDITLTADGKDTYAEVKREKRYRECKRTCGVSTTDLVGRMLLLTKQHHVHDDEIEQHKERARSLSTDNVALSPWTRVSRFIPTTTTILEFAEGRPPKPTDKVVYVCGAFDLFHIGHLSFLEKAAEFGDYLVVGILSDQVVNEYKGSNHPIMSLHERVLSVLAYKPVNEVVIGAPYTVSADLLDQFNVQVVVDGVRDRPNPFRSPDPFEEPKRRGIYREIDSGSDMTTDLIIERIISHRIEFESRNQKKEKKEADVARAMNLIKSKTSVEPVNN
ncbi:unnamed protein product [Caenorhabditis auriculariae]|uniref:ethanolamine-phosphate cytidylyltransferase n=1 Tax=Caenorhabditis auriculariae TaxID=2777116 RepID=A0A8S1GP67_9PELO|nr:unnamed protein product [Caenorhabditis auriculariae]